MEMQDLASPHHRDSSGSKLDKSNLGSPSAVTANGTGGERSPGFPFLTSISRFSAEDPKHAIEMMQLCRVISRRAFNSSVLFFCRSLDVPTTLAQADNSKYAPRHFCR